MAGIPDFRLPGASWIDNENDKAEARRLARELSELTAAQLIAHLFGSRRNWDEARVNSHTRQVIEAPERLRAEIKGWLRPCMADRGLFLDLGCGPGMLLAAALAEGCRGVGVDVSMVWLLVAQRLLRERGGRPVLAAALAESLPLADSSVSSVVSLDVIEHVADFGSYLREIDRVTRPQGCVALSTPNRFSMSAEPHVAVWGVGWLPYRFQKQYVRWRKGESYEFTRLLSTWHAASLLRRHTRFQCRILIPSVPEQEIAHFPPRRAALAKLYNRLAASTLLRWLFLVIGPFFRIVGTKSQAPLTPDYREPRAIPEKVAESE